MDVVHTITLYNAWSLHSLGFKLVGGVQLKSLLYRGARDPPFEYVTLTPADVRARGGLREIDCELCARPRLHPPCIDFAADTPCTSYASNSVFGVACNCAGNWGCSS